MTPPATPPGDRLYAVTVEYEARTYSAPQWQSYELFAPNADVAEERGMEIVEVLGASTEILSVRAVEVTDG